MGATKNIGVAPDAAVGVTKGNRQGHNDKNCIRTNKAQVHVETLCRVSSSLALTFIKIITNTGQSCRGGRWEGGSKFWGWPVYF